METKIAPPIYDRAWFSRDIVLGADDGIVTTFAIIAGSAGANLASRVVVVLGLAKLVADALSMAAGVFMGAKGEVEYEKSHYQDHWKLDSPMKQGLITFIAFLFAGFMPLIPYLLNTKSQFLTSSLILVIILFIVGAFKNIQAHKRWVRGGLEMVTVGTLVAIVAYLVGYLADKFII